MRHDFWDPESISAQKQAQHCGCGWLLSLLRAGGGGTTAGSWRTHRKGLSLSLKAMMQSRDRGDSVTWGVPHGNTHGLWGGSRLRKNLVIPSQVLDMFSPAWESEARHVVTISCANSHAGGQVECGFL